MPDKQQYEGKGAVGAGDYTIQPGDCVSSIANRAGHFWKTVWEHPDNMDLRKARRSPNILLPGDSITVPPLRQKVESGATNQRHSFVRKGEPARLHIRLMMEDFESNSAPGQASATPDKPRANQEYVLEIDDKRHQGTTDSDGWIDIVIPCDAQLGKLTIGPDRFQVDVNLGHLDPVEEISGLQARLTNLGYVCGGTGQMDDETRTAILVFQSERGLERTGEFDEVTRDKIKSAHGT